MGMDVDLYLQGAVSAEEFEAGRDSFERRLSFDDVKLERDYEGHVCISSLERYWAPGYERGDWPRIHSWIRALRAAFPGHAVLYGGDADYDEALEMTDGVLAEYWAHWESPQGNGYHDRHNMAAARPAG